MNGGNRLSFAKKAWGLVGPYWTSEEWRWAWGLSVTILCLTIGYVYISMEINAWSRNFYDALSDLDAPEAFRLLKTFSWLAALSIASFMIKFYATQVLTIRWRRWLTRHYTKSWLTERAYYGMQLRGRGVDNPDQRIQQDLNAFSSQSASLFFGIIREALMLFTFLGVLWHLSGPLEFSVFGFPMVIEGYMCWAALVYALGGTWISVKIGRPLIALDYEQEKREADYRYSLVRLRENAEAVALYGGERREEAIFEGRFKTVVKNYYAILHRMLLITGWSASYTQFAYIYPTLLALPKLFAGTFKFGGLFQTIGAFARVQDALSFVINNYVTLASWKATTQRLLDFQETVRQLQSAKAHGGEIRWVRKGVDEIVLKDLLVKLPDGQILLDHLNTQFPKGTSTLIVGASGTGKSTLLRVVAGLWPYGAGEVVLPDRDALLFLPQKPYMPLGSLAEVLCYPSDYAPGMRGQVLQVLEQVGLADLGTRLDEVNEWTRVLSLGEQQRVAVARALFGRPAWLLLDEATSAMDEEGEAALYAAIKENLPATTVISVGHRPKPARIPSIGIAAETSQEGLGEGVSENRSVTEFVWMGSFGKSRSIGTCFAESGEERSNSRSPVWDSAPDLLGTG